MKHLRTDYDDAAALDAKIPADEPVFLIRGQDPASRPALRAWATATEMLGGDPELVRRVREWADHMDCWAVGHGKKVADAPTDVFRSDF